MCFGHERLGEISAGHAGLVSDQNDEEADSVQFFDSSSDAGYQGEQREVAHITDLLIDRTVAVEKYRFFYLRIPPHLYPLPRGERVG